MQAQIRLSQLPTGSSVTNEDYVPYIDFPSSGTAAPVLRRVKFSDLLGGLTTNVKLVAASASLTLDSGVSASPLLQSSSTQLGVGVVPYGLSNAILSVVGNLRVGGADYIAGHTSDLGVIVRSSERLEIPNSGSLTLNSGYEISKVYFSVPRAPSSGEPGGFAGSATGITNLTLPDGIINQEKTVCIDAKAQSGSAKVIPTHPLGAYTNVTLPNIGSSVTFLMTVGGWMIKSYNDATVA